MIRRPTVAILAAVVWMVSSPATVVAADFDPHRYAFELFSEDEIAMSRYAGEVDEKEVSALLEKSWAEIDRAADRVKDLPPDEARKKIHEEVRGTDGIADRFESSLREKAGYGGAAKSPLDRMKQAAKHPAAWAVAVAFVALLFFVNRRRT